MLADLKKGRIFAPVINNEQQKLKTKKLVLLFSLVRMPACHAGGREFESRQHRRKPLKILRGFFVLYSLHGFF